MAEDNDINPIVEALNAEDDLGAVIRAHIHIEAALNDLIDQNFEFPEHLEKLHLEYYDKIIISQAMGLKDGYARALKALGKLRNNFAHRLDAELGNNEISSLYDAFDGEAKQIIQNGYKKTNADLGIKGEKSITKLPPRQQFTLIIIAMQKMLETAKSEFLET